MAYVALAGYRQSNVHQLRRQSTETKQLQSAGDCPRNKTFAREAHEHPYTVRPRRSTDKFARECHVTFPTVFTVSICTVRYSLSPFYILLISSMNTTHTELGKAHTLILSLVVVTLSILYTLNLQGKYSVSQKKFYIHTLH